MFPNGNIVGPVLFDCVTNSGVTNSAACWEDWICWLLLLFNKDASASLFITIMEMRRFTGLRGWSESNNTVEDKPTTLAILSASSPPITKDRREALARSVDNSQLVYPRMLL